MQNYRTKDPETSKIAGRAIENSGKAQNQRVRCLQAVLDNPGSTSAEIGQVIGVEDRYMASRRLPELRSGGLIINGLPRICKVNSTKALTWFPNRKDS